MSLSSMALRRVASVTLTALAMSACGGSPPASESAPAARAGAMTATVPVTAVRYTATIRNARNLYPDASWLPPEYDPLYADLKTTIEKFTRDSLTRDGLESAVVTATVSDNDATVAIEGADARIEAFGKALETFMDASHAGQALAGVTACMAGIAGCRWGVIPPPPPGGKLDRSPWAFFLPLGLPMISQKAVMLLDYPPYVSLYNPVDKTGADYLANNTLRRWSRILAAAGIPASDTVSYETIVDARPIAAPGSGYSSSLPDPTYFNTPPDRDYVTPMLRLLTDPPSNASQSTVPVVVLGGPAHAAWSAITGQKVGASPFVGRATLTGAAKSTPWVAGNHPAAEFYQCCPGDQAKVCIDTQQTKPNAPPRYSDQLIRNEAIDLQTACIVRTLAANPDSDVLAVKKQCEAVDPHTLCVQAVQDNRNHMLYGLEKAPDAAMAEALCQKYQDNACAPVAAAAR